MADELTKKQEKFVQNLILGMSQREAYKNSYNAERMSDKTIDSKACIMFKQEKIRARYKELKETIDEIAETRTIMSVIERKEFLTQVIAGQVTEEGAVVQQGQLYRFTKNPSLNDRMKALDILNKMDGEYKTVLEGAVEVKTKLEDLI